MVKRKIRREKFGAYEETRKQILLEDNEKEDRIIKRLAKKLKVHKKPKRLQSKSQHPAWVRQYGLDYILDFEQDLSQDKSDEAVAKSIGVLSKKKKKVDIYGQQQSAVNDTNTFSDRLEDVDSPDEDISSDNLHSTYSVEPLPVSPATGSSQMCPNEPIKITASSDSDSLRRSVRGWLNRVSEAQMTRVVTELTNLFSDHPRAVVRSILIEELCTLLESSPINTRSNTGWLQQELAVCIACVHISLHLKLQHDNLISYVVEKLVDLLFDETGVAKLTSKSASCYLFIAYLYRFDVVSYGLIFDLINKLLEVESLVAFKIVHVLCIAVGVNLRKADLKTCQSIIQLATEKLTGCNADKIEMTCELEGIVQRLSEKHSKNESVSRALHLKKMMRTWIKSNSLPDDVCLPVGLSDLLNRESNGRWWIVGAAGKQSTQSSISSKRNQNETPANTWSPLSPEVEAAAARLGLRTEARKLLFNTLVSTPGGPDATATALIRVCSSGHTGSAAREREMVQIVVHCMMAEDPFNRFYPRVLGGLINSHRRFLMMIKCAFWDVMKKTDLAVNAKANAGKALGLLAIVYDLPLTVLKNFNFGDTSDGNVAFLKHVFTELCTGDHQNVLGKLMQLSCYTHLSRNCRIFMRKHFSQDPDSHVKACVLRLVEDMRDSESF